MVLNCDLDLKPRLMFLCTALRIMAMYMHTKFQVILTSMTKLCSGQTHRPLAMDNQYERIKTLETTLAKESRTLIANGVLEQSWVTTKLFN